MPMLNPLRHPSSKTLSGLFTGLRTSFLDESVDLLDGMFELSVPDGYEDEAGFHLVTTQTNGNRHAVAEPVCLGENI